MSRVWAIAHRGASRDCPENTLASFDEALRQGADGIEMDLQLTRDGVPVVYHDRTLFRAGGGRRRVARLDLDELAALDPGARFDKRFRGQHIPALEEVLSLFGRRTRLLLEVKTREGKAGRDRHAQLARAAAALVSRMKLQANVMILSFDFDVLQAAAETVPGIRCVLNLRPPRRPGRRLLEQLPALFALSADIRGLTPGFAAAVHDAGRPILTYTCNTPPWVRRALEAGAIGVMSDRPAWLVERLRRAAEHAT